MQKGRSKTEESIESAMWLLLIVFIIAAVIMGSVVVVGIIDFFSLMLQAGGF